MGHSQSCCAYTSSRRRQHGAGGVASATPSPTSNQHRHQKKQKHRFKRSRSSNGGAGGGFGRDGESSERDGAGAGAHGMTTSLTDDHLSAAPNALAASRRQESVGNLQHISEREPDDWEEDPSLHPTTETMFMEKSKQSIANGMVRKRSQMQLAQMSRSMSEFKALKKSSSCSTIFLDDSTVSQPNLKNTIKCVALAIYYHIKNKTSDTIIEIFDERMHPLTKDPVSSDYNKYNPEHRQIYRFIRTLFNAAQLTAECAIITLVYLERLLKYAEVDIAPGSWKRITLGAILLASKVWDDQAVWNVDYCQILKDLTVEDMNELERQFLEMLQFNINVPSSVYAKYYFDLRTLAEANELSFPLEPLSKERALKLEALSQHCEEKLAQDLMVNGGQNGGPNGGIKRRCASLDKLHVHRRSVAILS